MDIALHLGAHLTDEDRLVRCLIKNREKLAAEDIAVPGTGRYRRLLIETVEALANGKGAPDAGQIILDDILDMDGAKRVVLSEADFLSPRHLAVRGTSLYTRAEMRLSGLEKMFAQQDLHLYLAIRNPASFLPTILQRLNPTAQETVRQGLEPTELRWSGLIEKIRSAAPRASVTVWCDEDTPFVWHQILHAVSGHSEDVTLEHSYDWFDSVLTPGGAEKLASYMEMAPPLHEAHRQRVISAFLDKFCDEEKIDVDVSIMGWQADTVDLLSELYEQDVDTISAMDGVTLLAP